MVKVAAIQRAVSLENEVNIKESLELGRRAVREHPGLDLMVFPEYNSSCAFDSPRIHDYAETMDGPYVTAMRELARESGCYVQTGTFIEEAGEKVRNTTLVIDRNGGIAGKYSKIHMSDAFGNMESATISAGSERCIVDTDFGRLGLFICFDLRFPELSRSLTLDGADILVISAMWPCGASLPLRDGHWDVLTRANAIYNLSYVIACNEYRQAGSEAHFGMSRIIDPWGEVISHASNRTCIVYGELDMEYQKKIRDDANTFNCRRPDMYRV